MARDNLDTLHAELPELFDDHRVSPELDDEQLIFRIDDVESDLRLGEADCAGQKLVDEDVWQDLESIAIGELEYSAEAQVKDIFSSNFGFSANLIEALGAKGPGAPSKSSLNYPPTPDALAFYLPFHYYHPDWWGVYLSLEGVIWLAGDIVRRTGSKVNAYTAVRAARLFLYYHEAFHHKTECFATRLEISHRVPLYKNPFEVNYQKTFGTDDCWEEGLANAHALKETSKKIKNKSIEGALTSYIEESAPGYRLGVKFSKTWRRQCFRFSEDNLHSCFPQHARKNPEIWRSTPHMFNGISKISGRTNYIVPRNSPLLDRVRFRPLLPPNKLVRKLGKLANLKFVKHGANHDIYQASNGNKIAIPRHQRDLGKGLMQAILKEAGLDIGVSEFMSA